MINFKCESCGKSYNNVKDELAGRTGPCNQCGQQITVPVPTPTPVPSPIPDPPQRMSWEQVRRTMMQHWQWIGLGIACFVMLMGAWIWLPETIRKIILERFPVMSIIGFLATITFVLLILWRKNKPLFKVITGGAVVILAGIVFWPTIRNRIWPPAASATNTSSDTTHAHNGRKPTRKWIGYGFWGTALIGYLQSKGYLESILSHITPLIDTVKSFIQSNL